jgi:hypothetical protein
MEFATHIQWVATTLSQCLAMVPPSVLLIDIIVSHYKQPPPSVYNMVPPSPPSEPSRSLHDDGQNN